MYPRFSNRWLLTCLLLVTGLVAVRAEIKDPYIAGASFCFDCKSSYVDTSYIPIIRKHTYWYEDWYVLDYDEETHTSTIERSERQYEYYHKAESTTGWTDKNYGWDRLTVTDTIVIRRVDNLYLQQTASGWSFFFCTPTMTESSRKYFGVNWTTRNFNYSSGGTDNFQYNYGGSIYNIILGEKATNITRTWTDLGLTYYSNGTEGEGALTKELIYAYIPDKVNYPKIEYTNTPMPYVTDGYGMYDPEETDNSTYRGTLAFEYNFENGFETNPLLYGINFSYGYAILIGSDAFKYNSFVTDFDFDSSKVSTSPPVMMTTRYGYIPGSSYNNCRYVYFQNSAKTKGAVPPYSLKDAWYGNWVFAFAPRNACTTDYTAPNTVWNFLCDNWDLSYEEYWDKFTAFVKDPPVPVIYVGIYDSSYGTYLNGPTAITPIKAEEENVLRPEVRRSFNLQGLPVSPDGHGIVIKDGKKQFVR